MTFLLFPCLGGNGDREKSHGEQMTGLVSPSVSPAPGIPPRFDGKGGVARVSGTAVAYDGVGLGHGELTETRYKAETFNVVPRGFCERWKGG